MATPPTFYGPSDAAPTRCARLAVQSAGVTVELREILHGDKPLALLDTSQSATVPALKEGDIILEESFEIIMVGR